MSPPSPKDNVSRVIVGALWTLLLMIAGWGFVDSRDARAETRSDIAQMRVSLTESTQRVAVLEEAVKNQKEQLNRIERAVTTKPAF